MWVPGPEIKRFFLEGQRSQLSTFKQGESGAFPEEGKGIVRVSSSTMGREIIGANLWGRPLIISQTDKGSWPPTWEEEEEEKSQKQDQFELHKFSFFATTACIVKEVVYPPKEKVREGSLDLLLELPRWN